VCACFGVGADTIGAAVRAGATTVAEIGRALAAGTSCGSCQPELKRLIARHRSAIAAA
jgi:assimilatory nitrate reductase catalytic subunit